MMPLQIIQHTPVWVWGLLVALVAFGLSQARDRAVSLVRMTILPLVLLALSFSGVISTFAHATIAILAWANTLTTPLNDNASITSGRTVIRARLISRSRACHNPSTISAASRPQTQVGVCWTICSSVVIMAWLLG